MSDIVSSVLTICPYCGTGCGVKADLRGDGTVNVAGDPDHPANFGRLCVKGSALAALEDSNKEIGETAIRALIAGETPKAILSDDTLVDMLKDKGFDIARRTVAKYREAMGIGSSVQRRRARKLAAL